MRRAVATTPVWQAYLLVGAVCSVATGFSHQWWGTWGATALQLTTGLAVIAGIRRFRPSRPAFWWLLGAGQLAYAIAQGYWRIAFDGWKPAIPFRSVDDVLYFAALGLFIAALAVRALTGASPGQRRAAAIDGFVVVLGLSSGTWHFIAEPFLTTHRLDATGTALFWTYEGMELLRMAFLFMIVLSGTVRDRAQRLIVIGMTVQLAGDLAYGIGMNAAVNPADGWQNTAWLLGSVIIGAAALHPDMAGGTRLRHDPGAISGRRLAVFVLLTAVSPVMTGLDALLGQSGTAAARSPASLAVWIPMILTTGVSALLVLRMGMIGTIAQRRATALDAALREQEKLRAELEHRALHDPLTGLGNRAMLNQSLVRATALPAGSRGWLLLLDLDGFKAVNDVLGHPVGDDLLVRLAADLRTTATGAVVTRLGGDEFAVLLPAATAPQAEALAGAVLRLSARERSLAGVPVRVSASIGLLDLDLATDSAQALKDVDLALYAAKAAGRNQFQVFDPRRHRPVQAPALI